MLDYITKISSCVFRQRLKGTILACLILVMAGCNGEQPTGNTVQAPRPAPPAYQGTIVAVGDSLTAGLGVDESQAYPAQLARKLHGDGYLYRVVNAGVSGETSSGALARIQWVISSLAPHIVILETGANDGLRGQDPDRLKANLDQLITTLKAHDIGVILAGMKMLPNLGPEYTRAFETIYPEMARKHGVILVPFFLEGVAGDSRFNQPDKLHPTAPGYGRIVENLYPHVLAAIKSHKRGK